MFVLCYSYNTFQDCICASYLLKYPSLPSLLISKFQYFSKLLYAHLQELDGNSLRLSTNPTCPTYLQIWSMRNNGKTYGGDTGNVFISIEVYRCVCVCVCVYKHAHVRYITQSRPTLCNPINCSLPGSSVHGDLQASILEWVAMLFSRGSSQPRD